MSAASIEPASTRLLPQGKHRAKRWAKRWVGALPVIALVVAWEMIGRSGQWFFLPAFSEVLTRVSAILTDPLTGSGILGSLARALGGLLIATVAGIAGGLLLGSHRWLDPWTRPALELMRSAPAPVYIPLGLVLLGYTDWTRLWVISFGCLWPILVNSVDGVRRVEPLLLDVARVSGTSRWRTLLHVALPASLPQTFPGLRIALSLSLVMTILSEMVGASSGLGYVILSAQQTFRFADMWAGVVIAAAISALATAALMQMERRVIRWSGSRRQR